MYFTRFNRFMLTVNSSVILDINDNAYSSRDGFELLSRTGTFECLEYYLSLLNFFDKSYSSKLNMLTHCLSDVKNSSLKDSSGWNRSLSYQRILSDCWPIITALSCRRDLVLESGLLPSLFPSIDFGFNNIHLSNLTSSVQNNFNGIQSPSSPIPLRVGTRTSFIDNKRLSCQTW